MSALAKEIAEAVVNAKRDFWWESDVETMARRIAAADAAIAPLVEALTAVVRCFDLSEGLSVRDEMAIKHAAAILARAGGDA
jgi:hypothetical protein